MKTRKELKEEFKQTKYKTGVFQIRNNVNDKIFIGSSPDLKAIWYAQKLQLDMGMHKNHELQKEWNHFGAENFTYEIIEELEQSDDPNTDINKELMTLEELTIEVLQPYENKGYNKRKNQK